MDRFLYPAIFHPEQDGGFSVRVPDLEGCYSEGETLDEAYINIVNAVESYIDDLIKRRIQIPQQSPMKMPDKKEDLMVLIPFHMNEYSRKYSKSVSKNLTIPGWLNALAEEKHINFSSVLQKALIEICVHGEPH